MTKRHRNHDLGFRYAPSNVKENLKGWGLLILLFLTMFVLAIGLETLFPRFFWYY